MDRVIFNVWRVASGGEQLNSFPDRFENDLPVVFAVALCFLFSRLFLPAVDSSAGAEKRKHDRTCFQRIFATRGPGHLQLSIDQSCCVQEAFVCGVGLQQHTVPRPNLGL